MFAKKLLTVALCASMGVAAVANAASFQGHDVVSVERVQPAATFSFPLYQTAELDFAQPAAQAKSNEYWFTVSGDELNKGVAIQTTAPGAVLLVTRNGESSAPLSVNELSLTVNGSDDNAVETLYSEEEMNAVGIFSNAIAVKAAAAAEGDMTLSYAEKLDSKQQFVVSVKEKNSQHLMALSSPKMNYLQGETLTFNAAIETPEKALAMTQAKAFIVSPSGKKVPVSAAIAKDGSVTVKHSEFARVEAPINGLYELQLEGYATDAEKTVRRMAKVAFAMAPQTAELADVTASVVKGTPRANVAVSVNEPGRYEVRAVLYGTNKAGEQVAVMETHSATFLKAGEQSIAVNFDAKILAASGASAPFSVNHVRLNDQTRLSNLSVVDTAVDAK